MSEHYEEYLTLGLITTRVGYRGKNNPPMSKLEEYESRRELREGFEQLFRAVNKPQIILAPELSTPRSFIKELEKHACALSSICIFGIDYLLNYTATPRTAKNEIIIMVPDRWPRRNYNRKTYRFSIFKSNPAPDETKKLLLNNWTFSADNRLWLFDAGPYGVIGVANCYDFLDVEMHLLYRAKIQHLFVLSYNKDFNSFWHTAESLCRTLFCNVVVCNTGYYGGSVCVSPYDAPHERTIFRAEGRKLFTTQVIKLPVKKIIKKQRSIESDNELKELPPGFLHYTS